MLWELKARVYKMLQLNSVSTIWAPDKTRSIAIKDIPQSTQFLNYGEFTNALYTPNSHENFTTDTQTLKLRVQWRHTLESLSSYKHMMMEKYYKKRATGKLFRYKICYYITLPH